jgi:endonuclease/exonuclease/phosphatase family metal-dependent hydrolase
LVKVQQLVLQQDPDVIALQEVPSFVLHSRWFSEYSLIGYQESHAHNVVLLVHKRHPAAVRVDIDTRLGLPAVMAEIDFLPPCTNTNYAAAGGNRRKILVTSVHLEPFVDGARMRKRQLGCLAKIAMERDSTPLLIAGDTNMRVAEDPVAEQKLGFLDLWKVAGSDFGTKYTWNTRNELKDGRYFNEYYGGDTREYVARYDRIYAANVMTASTRSKKRKDDSSEEESQDSIENATFDLVANRPVGDSKRHFLSDHFGITSTVQVVWKD